MKSEWKEYKLGDIASMKYGKMLPNKNVPGKYPVFSGYRVVGWTNSCNCKSDTPIVVARGVGGTGDVKILKTDCFLTNLSIMVDIDRSLCHPYYFYYKYLLNNLKWLDTGSAQSQITIDDLRRLSINLPPLPIQRKIASMLSALDDKIETNNAICRNLEEQIKLIFKETYAAKVKDSSAGIENVTLADVCSVITKGTTPSTLGHSFENEGVNFVKAESITNCHRIEKNKISFISLEAHNKLKRSQVEDGDILFSIAGTLGRFTLVDTHILPANTNQAVAIIRANKEKVAPEYLYSLFIAGWHEEYCKKNVQQAVQANLSLGIIKSLPIFLLLGQEMKNYLSKITPLITTMKKLERESSCLAYLRDTLLPKLMSGELSVENIN